MRRVAAFVAAGIVVALALALLVSPHASSEPDGLERVAIDAGFADTAASDGGGEVSSAAKVVGVALVFVATGGLLVVARRRTT